MGKAGFADESPGDEHAVGRLEEAARHRARAGAGARAAAARRAHQPPRRRRHPLARGAAAARARGLRGGEPRPLLPRSRGRARDRAQPRVRRRASSTCADATAASWRRRTSCWPDRPPTRSRSATACAASSTGCRARRVRARARRRRASTRPSGCRTSSPTSTRARRSAAVGLDFAATERRTKRLVVAEGVTRELRRAPDRARPRPRALAGNAARPARRERQRQEHAAAPARAPGAAGRGARSTHADGLKVVMFDQHRSAPRPRGVAAADARAARRLAWCSRAAASTWPAGPSASCSARSSSRRPWAGSRAASRRAWCSRA